ncbi:hypothetical protein [Hyphococcus luteus]|nr:hypothetical protein [Marinicaulis flavus]
MDRINEDRLDDEFEPIELGSVSEMTMGEPGDDAEFTGEGNTKPLA